MRLTEPGLYVARDGRRAMSYQSMTGMSFVIAGEDTRCDFNAAGSMQTEGDWQRIDLAAVKWPELPPKPRIGQCYTRFKRCVCWRVFSIDDRRSIFQSSNDLKDYEVVYHPDNDREAVAMIEAAKEDSQRE